MTSNFTDVVKNKLSLTNFVREEPDEGVAMFKELIIQADFLVKTLIYHVLSLKLRSECLDESDRERWPSSLTSERR